MKNPFFFYPARDKNGYWMFGTRLPFKSTLLFNLSKGEFWYNKTEEGDKRYNLLRLGWETNTHGWTIYCATVLWLSIQLGVYRDGH